MKKRKGGKFANRLAKSCFSETNEDNDSSSNSDNSMEDGSTDNRVDGKERKQNEIFTQAT